MFKYMYIIIVVRFNRGSDPCIVRAGTHGEILLGTRKHTVNFWLVNTHFCIHVSIVHRAFA